MTAFSTRHGPSAIPGADQLQVWTEPGHCYRGTLTLPKPEADELAALLSLSTTDDWHQDVHPAPGEAGLPVPDGVEGFPVVLTDAGLRVLGRPT